MNDRILIIDDDQELLAKFQKLLHRAGYEVEMLSESVNALEWVERIKARAILLDLEMAPQMRLRSKPVNNIRRRKKIGIIPMSKFFSHKENSTMMKDSGIEELLIKPFGPISLISKVQFILPQNKIEQRQDPLKIWEDLN